MVVNPPVHAWAAWRVYQLDREPRRERRSGLSRAHLSQPDAQFHLMGNRKGADGRNIFQGVSRAPQYRFVRPQRPAADGWSHQPIGRYRLDGDVHAEPDADRARIGHRKSRLRGHSDKQDELYYDCLCPPLWVCSMVGPIPLFAVECSTAAFSASCPNSPLGCAGFSKTGRI